MKNHFLLTLLLFIIGGHKVKASESVVVFTDKEVYVTGESIWYSLDLISEDPYTSKYAVVEILSKDGGIVGRQKIVLEDKKGTGRFYLNKKIPTGSIIIRAYTSWLADASCDDIFYKTLLVVNPLNPIDITNSLEHQQQAASSALISLDFEPQLNTRQSSTITITNHSDIHIDAYLSIYLTIRPKYSGKTEIVSEHLSKANAIPELNYPILAGKVTKKPNDEIQIIISGEMLHWHSSPILPDGSFFAELIDARNQNRIYAWNGSYSEPLYIEDHNLYISENRCVYSYPKVEFSIKEKHLLEQVMVNSQIQNIYKEKTHPKEQEMVDDISYSSFFEPVDAFYNLDEYKRFPSIKETLIEYVKEVYLRKDQNGKRQPYTFDDYRKVLYPEPALILLDHIPVSFSYLMEINPLLIKSIEVTNSILYFGSKKVHGLISVKSFDGYFKNNPLPAYVSLMEFQPISSPVKFFTPVRENSRLPDRRTTLIWQRVQMAPGETVTIPYNTSDVKGGFSVKVEATHNQNTIRIEDYLTVQ